MEQRFVAAAGSHQGLRQDMWAAYRLWARRARHHLGGGEAWLAGTFVTDSPREPRLRVVLFARTPSMVGNAIRRGDVGLGLLTVEDVFYLSPSPGGSVNLIRPFGGMLDVHLGAAKDAGGWDAMWSVLGDQPGTTHLRAGYVKLAV